MSWSPLTEVSRAGVAALAMFVLAVAAEAEDPAACSQFKWPLATEKSWFEAGDLKDLQSGTAAGHLAPGAFTLSLRPSTEVSFALPPEGKPKADKHLGAVLSFATVAAPGRYQVTLSDEAWIDIVQDGAYRPSLDFSGVHGCPGVRKSVRFDFKRAPLVLQLSSASAETIKVAIQPVK
jgi:hypothetical protein